MGAWCESKCIMHLQFQTSIGGYKYFVTWIDFLKNKECAMVAKSFVNYMAWTERQRGLTVKRIRTDNGGKYTRWEFIHICNEKGVIHETMSPHTPEHNGMAERYNRVLQEGALVILFGTCETIGVRNAHAITKGFLP